jgi:polyisoprenoid-binding protein YceI
VRAFAPSLALLLALPVAHARSQSAAPETRLVVASTDNEARYRVREQLAGVDLPNDAVGRTPAVSGQIVLAADGTVLTDQSLLTIDLRSLASDKERRDGYVQRRLLETEQFPTATLRVTALRGVSTPLPTAGPMRFTLEGDLTVHGVTRPTTWDVSATASPTGYTGTATTNFRFETFGLTKPRVAVVLSVEDTIALEYDFALRRQ